MSATRAWATTALAICERDFRLFVSYRTRFVSTFITTAVSVTLFYYISRLVRSPKIGSPDEYYGFVVVGMVILSVLTSTLTTPVGTLRQELVAGTFERMVVSAAGPIPCIASLMLFPLLVALVNALVTLLYASLVFGLSIRGVAPIAVPLAALGAAAFAPFGLLMTAGVVTFKQTNAGANLIVTGLTLVAGFYFPVTLLPEWIRWTADVQPFTPAVDLLRHFIVGIPMRGSVLAALLKLVAFAAVLLPAAAWALRASLERSRRRGTLIEY